MSEITLRPYQVEAGAAIRQQWEEGRRRTLLVLPTGLGKTVVLSKVAEEEVKDGKRVLILAHRDELLKQAADKLRAVTGMEAGYERAGESAMGCMWPVTVGSVQSLCRPARLERYPGDYYGTLIVDEAHHALSDSYQRVLGHFPEANVLGVTATPDRGDRRTLSSYFDSIAYEYGLRQAIEEGYLVPLQAKMIPLRVDLSEVSLSNGDYSARELGDALDPWLAQIAQEMAKECKGRKTVVFLPLIETSRRFCGMLQEAGMKACEVNGESADREEVIRDFSEGKYEVLCNSMLLTEGWDCPAVDCVVVLRPTRSRALYQQMIGRGMRLSPGKTELLILDFLWLSEKHSLCRPSCLISRDEGIAARMDTAVAAGGAVDLIQAEEQAERDALAEREKSLAAELARQRGKKTRRVDPLQFVLSIEDEDLASYTPTFAWEMGPASVKQLSYLEKLGIDPGTVRNMGMASLLIERLRARYAAGLSSPKQIRLLEGRGFRHVGAWSKEAASSMIGRLSQNNWEVPTGVTPWEYRP